MAQGTDGSFLHANVDVCVSFQRCLSGIWAVQFWITGKTFFSMTHCHPRTLFQKGFGYFKACHQDCPRPIVKFSERLPEATALVGSQPGQSLPLQPMWPGSESLTCRDAGRRGQQGRGRSIHHLLPWPRGWPPLTASLETLRLQMTSLQLHQMPFSPGTRTAQSDKVHFSLRNSSASLFTSLSDRCLTSLPANTVRQAWCTWSYW